MNAQLYSRLAHWKFRQALAYVQDEPAERREAVEALARLFGDVGWFDGDIGHVVRLALCALGVTT
jgi:hypothetical protein